MVMSGTWVKLQYWGNLSLFWHWEKTRGLLNLNLISSLRTLKLNIKTNQSVNFLCLPDVSSVRCNKLVKKQVWNFWDLWVLLWWNRSKTNLTKTQFLIRSKVNTFSLASCHLMDWWNTSPSDSPSLIFTLTHRSEEQHHLHFTLNELSLCQKKLFVEVEEFSLFPALVNDI